MSDINNRIQRLEDIKSIEQLKYKYLHACDDKDPEAMISVFTEKNCEIDYGEVGVFNDREILKKVQKIKTYFSLKELPIRDPQ